MATVKERTSEMLESSGVSSDVENLKSSFSQLREEVVDLLSHAFGLGKTGAGAARDGAANAMGALKERLSELKDKGADGVSAIEKKIEDNPLPAALIAFGVGYVIAKILTRRR